LLRDYLLLSRAKGRNAIKLSKAEDGSGILTARAEIAIEFEPHSSTSVPASDQPTSAVVSESVAAAPGIDPDAVIDVPPKSVREAL
jgi:hypothetical protein